MIKFYRKELNTLKNGSDFYISQFCDGVSIGYKPLYPESSNGDFSIVIDKNGYRMIQTTPTLPIIKRYKNWNDIMSDLKDM